MRYFSFEWSPDLECVCEGGEFLPCSFTSWGEDGWMDGWMGVLYMMTEDDDRR